MRVSDGRAAGWVRVNLAAIFVCGGRARAALVTDLGMEGLFAETAEPPRRDSRVIVVFGYPRGGLRLLGIVRWTKQSKMGVEFEALAAQETRDVETLVAALPEVSRSAAAFLTAISLAATLVHELPQSTTRLWQDFCLREAEQPRRRRGRTNRR